MRALMIVVLVAGCQKLEVSAVPMAQPTSLGDPAEFEHPPVDLPPQSRGIKRLTVSQLRNSLPVVAGNGITWTTKHGGEEVDLLGPRALAPTLGEPDFVQTTTEAAEPTALYVKFMDDMSRDVCVKMNAAGTLTKFEDVDANLRYLKLRLLGEKIADDDTESIADLRAVHTSGGGWVPVCVAVMSSPAFHLY